MTDVNKYNYFNIKMLLVLLVSFFVGINGTKACSCYYAATARHKPDGTTAEFTPFHYYARIDFNGSKLADGNPGEYAIIHDDMEYKDNRTFGSVIGMGNVSGLSREKIKEIVKSNCSFDACKTVNFYLDHVTVASQKIVDPDGGSPWNGNFSATITTNSTDMRFPAITEDEANEFKSTKKGDMQKFAKDHFKVTYNSTDPSNDMDGIKKWGKKTRNDNSSSGKEYKNITCQSLFGDKVLTFLNNIFSLLQIIGIILLIITSSIEFIKSIAADEEDALQKALKHLKNRIIVLVVLLILPFTINWILSFINKEVKIVKYGDENKKVVIGDKSNSICIMKSGDSK